MLAFRKLAAVLCLSVGVALLVLPFPDRLEGEGRREVVRLEVGPAPFTETSARDEFGPAFVPLDYEGLEATPGVLDAVLSLMDDSGARCVPAGEWRTLLDGIEAEAGPGLVYAFRDGIYQVTGVELVEDPAEGELACVEVAFLGAYDNPEWGSMTWLDPGDLEGYPAVRAEVERLAAAGVAADQAVDIPSREWRRFHRRELDDLDFRPAFVASDRLLRGSIDHETVPWTLDTPWLRGACMTAGAGLALLGVFVLVAAYGVARRRSGIPIAPAWVAVFCDLVLLVWGVVFAGLVLDTLWVAPLGQPSLLGLAPEWPSTQPITGLHFVSLPALLLALPLMTLFFTSLSSQRVRVDEQGVTSLGAVLTDTLPWQDLERVRIREQRNPFAFTVTDFRKLQRVLDLEGGENTVTINEPATRTRKQAVVDALLEHVPDEKRPLLGTIDQW